MKSDSSTPKIQSYFDCNATSPLSPEVMQNIAVWAAEWGNPSSIHAASRGPKTILRETRQKVATALGVHPLEIVFTSGGSESNNTVIKSIFETSAKNHFITSQVEHPSVIKTMQAISALGAQVDYIPVSRSGFLDLDFYKEKINSNTALVSVMTANNETGNLFPIQQCVQMAHDQGALFHTDAVQALGKIPVNLKALNVDYASFSAHKFYALKGTGVLYIKKGNPLESLILGGGQERHRRGGTENILGIAALGKMAEFLSLTEEKSKSVEELRDYLETRIQNEISDVKITGHAAPRLSNTSSLVIAGVDGETLLMSLDLKGFCVSTGAACSSGNPEPSPVLLSMGLSREEAQSSLRVSLSWFHKIEDVDRFVEALIQVVARLRKISEEAHPRKPAGELYV